jgi:hypothetical protein
MLGLSFTLLFTAFQAMANLQSSINSEVMLNRCYYFYINKKVRSVTFTTIIFVSSNIQCSCIGI